MGFYKTSTTAQLQKWLEVGNYNMSIGAYAGREASQAERIQLIADELARR